MITRFGFAPRLPGLTVARFQEHWRERHGPIIGALPGLARYWQNHVLPGLPWPGFDACSEMDAEDFDAVFAHDHYLTEGRADERRFVDRSVGGAMYVRRIGPEQAIRPVRLLTFLRAAPGVTLDRLAETLDEGYVRIEGTPEYFDAVESRWFDDPSEAHEYLTSPDFERNRRTQAGMVRGTEHLLAQVHEVPLRTERIMEP
jgi:hypothetical protein